MRGYVRRTSDPLRRPEEVLGHVGSPSIVPDVWDARKAKGRIPIETRKEQSLVPGRRASGSRLWWLYNFLGYFVVDSGTRMT